MKGTTMRREYLPNRRLFLKRCLVGTIAGFSSDLFSHALSGSQANGVPARSRVAIVRDALLRQQPAGSSSNHTSLDPGRLRRLLDSGVNSLFGTSDPLQVWTAIVHPGQTVGIKVNTLGGRGLSSNVQLVEAICERLLQAGIRAPDIVVWDRDTDELRRAGFQIRTGGNQVQCFGTDQVGFEDALVSFGTVGSQLSKILTRRCDVLINVPVLKDHDGAGVSIALKNMYGVIHNPNKYHPNGCNPSVADVNMLPDIRARLRLHICDATIACYEGGPAFKPEFAWQENALILSQDPVALDAIGRQMIERKRAEEGLKSLAAEGRAPRYIETAADPEHRLGIHDPRQIDVVEAHAA